MLRGKSYVKSDYGCHLSLDVINDVR
jgi:hypothetical protein